MLDKISSDFLTDKYQLLIVSQSNEVLASDNSLFNIPKGSIITDFHPFFYTIATLFDDEDKDRTFYCVQLEVLNKIYFVDIKTRRDLENMQIYLMIENLTDHYKNIHEITQVRNESIIQFNLVKELNQQLEIQRGFKNKFLANVSHEIRTPLNSIKGFLNVLKMTDISQEQLDIVNIINDSSDALVNILEDLMDLSKIEAGKLEIKNRRFDFKYYVDSLIKTYELRSEEKRLDFDVEIGENIPQYLVGDRLRINQILINLLENALRYTHQGSIKLKISTDSRNLRRIPVTFEVVDTGVGIAKENLQKIFESFTQLEKRGLFGGSGLGLSIVKQLTELMESELEVSSVEGEGSSFKFTLVLGVSHNQKHEKKKSAEAILAAKPVGTGNVKKKSILYGEDIEVNQLLIMKFFNEKGSYNLDIAKNGEWVIKYLERYQYDLVLLDLTMPVMDGFDTATQIRNHQNKKLRKIPIIALSARSSDEEKEAAKNVGINAYLTKPVDPDELFKLIDKQLNKYKKKEKE